MKFVNRIENLLVSHNTNTISINSKQSTYLLFLNNFFNTSVTLD